jgi:hypothetical protein
MFFLGAGASVDAGLPDVVAIVGRFLDWSDSQAENPYLDKEQCDSYEGQAALTREILTIIQDWKTKQNDDTKIDIEILLETVEKIENRDQQPLSAFYENTSLNIEKHLPIVSFSAIRESFQQRLKSSLEYRLVISS